MACNAHHFRYAPQGSQDPGKVDTIGNLKRKVQRCCSAVIIYVDIKDVGLTLGNTGCQTRQYTPCILGDHADTDIKQAVITLITGADSVLTH